jgi:hypothetical protein
VEKKVKKGGGGAGVAPGRNYRVDSRRRSPAGARYASVFVLLYQ